ncbi:related to thioesterase [Melanopsichium pennsylvanicum]|uniref:Related to thioesterase n=1 Tax=Melanopsichium pennsylvanicum TaxID=63383 RepID=A0AAJ5C500_9BASI|nr:related to thioesterase [Melanopsichium pennsylvanicum]
MWEAKDAWPHTVTYQTRWLDNDQYGHLNNSSYYLIADSIINAYLINSCGIQPFIHSSPSTVTSSSSSSPNSSSSKIKEDKIASQVVGLVISNSCRYYASCSFPNPLTVALRLIKLGKSSVTYQVSIAEQGKLTSAALITSTHVFVNRVSRRPVTIPNITRDGLAKLVVDLDQQQDADNARSKL